MKEISEHVSVSLDVINPNTGEVFSVNGLNTKSSKYYNIKKLNFKGSIMDLFSYQAKLCKSSKDIELFRDLLFIANKHNELRINISEFANKSTSSRQRITKFLADAVTIGFMKRLERGVYAIDPFAFRSKGATNEMIEAAQNNWSSL